MHSRLANAEPKSGTIGSAVDRVPFPVTSWALRFLARLPRPGVAPVTAGVPGRCDPLQVMGRRVVSVIPTPGLATGSRTGVSVLSYADDVYRGILTDFEAVPDVDTLTRGVEAAVRRLIATASGASRSAITGDCR
ncbi:WS/DGAT domain-containing protein [Mycobacterium sp. NPDC048908]|uniref:WS/DGAT domain-containing protein n=1 Tax=Mycobacterium sp. NPDC048908 TaxID=3364292 RepID=UPI00371D9D29